MRNRTRFILEWVFISLVGWLYGVLLAFIVGYFFYSVIEQPIYNSFLPIFVLTLGTGFVQWFFSLRMIVSSREVIFASVASAILCTIAQYLLNQFLPEAFFFYIMAPATTNTYRLLDDWLITTLISSIALGLSYTLPQWFILRQHKLPALAWIPANLLGIFAAFLLFLVSGNFNFLGLVCSGCLLSPVAYALITGFTLYNIISQTPKPQHDTAPPLNSL